MRDDSFLEQAVACWSATKKQSRDGRLTVGRLVQLWLSTELTKAEALNEEKKAELGLTRLQLVKLAKKKLSISTHVLNRMIQAAAVVDILSDGKELGELSWTGILAMSMLVKRPDGTVRRTVAGKGLSPADKEKWVAVDLEIGKQLFSKALDEKLDADEIRSMMPNAKKGPARKKPTVDIHKNTPISFRKISEAGNPKDVADMVMEMIKSHPKPDQVWRNIMEMMTMSRQSN